MQNVLPPKKSIDYLTSSNNYKTSMDRTKHQLVGAWDGLNKKLEAPTVKSRVFKGLPYASAEQPKPIPLSWTKSDLHFKEINEEIEPVSYTHLRAHETVLDLVCRLLLEKKN